jgi:4-amino-4-deoxy-L-arabinose transferase-like glycosyltransferase
MSFFRFWMPRIIGLACLAWLVYEWMAGSSGLSMSEGHRAIPAWEMLHNGNWFAPSMFEQPYLRKPPGMSWAIAGMSMMLGESELAARSVSALCMFLAACLSAWCAQRWFGPAAAFAAGAAHLLTPWFWESGRAAEIEALHNLGVVMVIWGLVDQLVMPRQNGWNVRTLVLFGGGILVAGLAKGPAAVLILLGLIAAAWVVKPGGGWSGLRHRVVGLMATTLLAAVVLTCVGILIWQRTHAGAVPPITQSVTEFLWSPDRIGKILLMPPTVILSMLPLSAAAAWVWVGGGWRSGVGQPVQAGDAARLLVVGAVLSILLFLVCGVSNPRYLLPVGAMLSPVAGLAVAQSLGGVSIRWQCVALRSAILIASVVLVLGSVVYTLMSESSRRMSSGKMAGIRLADQLPPGAVVMADDLIEARPEVLWYAQRAAAERGSSIRFIWTPASMYASGTETAVPMPPGITHALLRTDARSNEPDRLARILASLGLSATQMTDRVGPENRPFEFRLYQKRNQNMDQNRGQNRSQNRGGSK